MTRWLNASDICPGCGSATHYYDGALGYQAHVCCDCKEHWSDATLEEYSEHLERYKGGERNGIIKPRYCVVIEETFTRTTTVELNADAPKQALAIAKERLRYPEEFNLQSRESMVRDAKKGGSSMGDQFYRVHLVDVE